MTLLTMLKIHRKNRHSPFLGAAFLERASDSQCMQHKIQTLESLDVPGLKLETFHTKFDVGPKICMHVCNPPILLTTPSLERLHRQL